MTMSWQGDERVNRRRFLGLAAAGAGCLTIPGSAAGQAEESLTPEMFGAVGDGRTDDSPAFRRLNQRLAASGGGLVRLRAGATYIIGAQRRSASYYLEPEHGIYLHNGRRLIVEMNGATIKFRNGVKFGSFDPRTGRRLDKAMPNVDTTVRADAGAAIWANRVGHVSISGGRIDCNSQGLEIGGHWGDVGWQCAQFGIATFSCDRVELRDLHISNSAQDGIVYGYHGLRGDQPLRPLIVRNVTVDRAARNCVSVIGTNSATFEDCTFQRAGEAPNGRVGNLRSPPGSCFDLEAEEAQCRRLVIRRCNLISGRHSFTAFVADSGDSADILIEDSQLIGAIWTAKPRTIFNRCRMHGDIRKLYGGSRVVRDNTQLIDCQISDAQLFEAAPTTNYNVIDLEAAGSNVLVSGTTFDVTRTRVNLRGAIVRNVTINFATGTNAIENRGHGILLDNARVSRLRINERIPPRLRPADAFYIMPAASTEDAVLDSPAQKLLWNSWSPGANGYTGRYRG